MPRRPPPAAGPVMQKMEKAFNDLANTITLQDSRNFQHTSLDDVRQSALEIERELAARQSLRNMRRLMPLFIGLEHYAATMGIVCNGTPFLPWVWAPITLILRIASEYVEAFEQIIKGYARIAGSLKRFNVLGQAFSGDSEFEYTLATFYEDILEFHKYAYKFVRRNGWRIVFMTSWGRFQRRFENILENMERHGALIDQEANARNIAEGRAMRHDLRSWREETLLSLGLQEDAQFNEQYQSVLSWLYVEAKHQNDQLAIIDKVMTEISKYPDVYISIMDCTKVKGWLQRNSTLPMLWIQGITGSGKTFVAAQLIRFLEIAKMPLLYHFCSDLYPTSLTYEQIIRSLISQVAMRDKDLVAFIYKDYVGKKQPRLQVLEDLLRNLLAASSAEPNQSEFKWIIIDGLDECSSEQQNQVLGLAYRNIAKLSSSSSPGNNVCKFLITSQVSPEISRRIRKEHTLYLSNERSIVDKAIQLYVKQRMYPLFRRFQSLDLSEQQFEAISDTVVKKADGMFLYARLVLDYLSTNIFMDQEAIKSSLDLLPAKLTDLYEKLLAQMLGKLDERSVNHVRCVFGWVAFQKKPLKRLEFLSAVTFSQGNPAVKNLAPEYIFDICGTLLDQRPDTTITFVHSSVKTFLRNSSNMLRVKEEDIIKEHSLATIACLLSGFDVFGGDLIEHECRLRTVKGIHGLHVYSTEFWAEYLLASSQLPGGLKENSLLFERAYDLVEILEAVDGNPEKDTAKSATKHGTESVEERLGSLEKLALLLKHAEASLNMRSLKALESSYNDQQPIGPVAHCSTNHVDRILQAYQETVRFLLSQDDFPGVSAEMLKSFKTQFSSALFTCRLHSCPRATCGFETQDLLRAHELSHTRRYPCTFHGCQSPPFGSQDALRRHNRKYHDPAPPAKIRHQRTRGENRPKFLPGVDRPPDLKGDSNFPDMILANPSGSVRSTSPKSLKWDEKTTKSPNATPVVTPFSPPQLRLLRQQIHAFKSLVKNHEMPLPMQEALFARRQYRGVIPAEVLFAQSQQIIPWK